MVRLVPILFTITLLGATSSIAHAVRTTGTCRLSFSDAATQSCYPAARLQEAEERFPVTSLDPSAMVLGATGLSLTQVVLTRGFGDAGTTPAVNYEYGKLPAVHGYLRTTPRGPRHLPAIWRRPHFMIVRELLGRHVPRGTVAGRVGLSLVFLPLPPDVTQPADAVVILTRGMSYYISYMPTRHLSLFVTTNLAPDAARSVGQSIVDAARRGK
jgi:hypothetical protein